MPKSTKALPVKAKNAQQLGDSVHKPAKNHKRNLKNKERRKHKKLLQNSTVFGIPIIKEPSTQNSKKSQASTKPKNASYSNSKPFSTPNLTNGIRKITSPSGNMKVSPTKISKDGTSSSKGVSPRRNASKKTPELNNITYETETMSLSRRRGLPTSCVKLTPWFIKTQSSMGRLRQLHQEIMDFTSWIQPTEEERYARHLVVQRLQLILEKIFNDKNAFVLKPFGSYDTGLYLPTSDIDVVIVVDVSNYNLLSAMNPANNSPQGNILRKLARQLYKMTSIVDPRSIKLISHARVPIVKYIDRPTGFEVDVSVNVGSGLDGARMIRQCLQEFPALRRLTLVLKHFLALRRLNEVFTGGLGSFALICLIVSFLQHHPLVQSRLIDPLDGNLGVLLMDFLELYGLKFNYEQVGISLRNGGSYFIRASNTILNRNDKFYNRLSLCIEDPQNPANDLSKGSYCFDQVRDAFRHAFHALVASLQLEDCDDSVLGCIVWSTTAIARQREFIQTHTNL